MIPGHGDPRCTETQCWCAASPATGERAEGRTKLVYDKEKRTIVKVHTPALSDVERQAQEWLEQYEERRYDTPCRLVRDLLSALRAAREENERLRSVPILGEVVEERWRQDEKWGEQNHRPFKWLAILMEEVGEASKAALGDGKPGDYRMELIEVAAVAVAAIESLDRGQP